MSDARKLLEDLGKAGMVLGIDEENFGVLVDQFAVHSDGGARADADTGLVVNVLSGRDDFITGFLFGDDGAREAIFKVIGVVLLFPDL